MWYPLFLLGLSYFYVFHKKWGLFGLGPPFGIWFVLWLFWPSSPSNPGMLHNARFDIPGPLKYAGIPKHPKYPDNGEFKYTDLNDLILQGDVPALSLLLQRDLSKIAERSSGNATGLHFVALLAGKEKVTQYWHEHARMHSISQIFDTLMSHCEMFAEREPTHFKREHLASEGGGVAGAIGFSPDDHHEGSHIRFFHWQGKSAYIFHKAKFDTEILVSNFVLSKIYRRLQGHCVSQNFDDDGATPFHRAAAGGSLEGLEVFFKHGVDVNCKDETGQTAVDVATIMRQWEVVKWLEERGGKKGETGGGWIR